MDCSMPGFPVHHQLPELTQTHVHRVGDAIQPSHPPSSPSPPAFNLVQHQDLFHWVSSSHQVAKVLEFQLQHQSFRWIFRTDFLSDRLVGSPCNPRDSNYLLSKKGHCLLSLCPRFFYLPANIYHHYPYFHLENENIFIQTKKMLIKREKGINFSRT